MSDSEASAMSADEQVSPERDEITERPSAGDQPSTGRVRFPAAETEAANANERKPASRPKRIACIICRKRKLRCDGERPSCGTCAKLGHSCVYDEVRRKSGPKRGYVKELEARLAQVETQLKSKSREAQVSHLPTNAYHLAENSIPQLRDSNDKPASGGSISTTAYGSSGPVPSVTINPAASEVSAAPSGEYSWEMLGLGLEEALPPAELIDELHQLYFDNIHPSEPMVHKYRYFAALNLAPHMRPPVCLRYAMWANAASVSDKHRPYAEVFYQRARKYAELDELKGHGVCFVTLGHCQAWSLLATFEFKMMYFPRAWMSTGRASRLTQMLNLQRVDGGSLEVKMTLPPPSDWTDREERRRTFWCAYNNDRYASIGTGWPMVLEEKDITTHLPVSDEAFEKSQPEESLTLQQALIPKGASSLSSFAGVSLVAYLFGRTLTHLHRPEEVDAPNDPINGEFWKRHRRLDSILNNTLQFLPPHLRMSANVQRNASVVFLNINIHAAIICLHQAAILKAERFQLDETLLQNSRMQCYVAAEEISKLIQMARYLPSAQLNPFVAFCLYVAARVFLNVYKRKRDDRSLQAKLAFLLTTMQSFRRHNSLAESFMSQIVLELETAGLTNPMQTEEMTMHSTSHLSMLGLDRASVGLQNPPTKTPSYHELQDRLAQRATLDTTAHLAPGTGLEPPTALQGGAPSSAFNIPLRARDSPSNGVNSTWQMQALMNENESVADPIVGASNNDGVLNNPVSFFNMDMTSVGSGQDNNHSFANESSGHATSAAPGSNLFPAQGRQFPSQTSVSNPAMPSPAQRTFSPPQLNTPSQPQPCQSPGLVVGTDPGCRIGLTPYLAAQQQQRNKAAASVGPSREYSSPVYANFTAPKYGQQAPAAQGLFAESATDSGVTTAAPVPEAASVHPNAVANATPSIDFPGFGQVGQDLSMDDTWALDGSAIDAGLAVDATATSTATGGAGAGASTGTGTGGGGNVDTTNLGIDGTTSQAWMEPLTWTQNGTFPDETMTMQAWPPSSRPS